MSSAVRIPLGPASRDSFFDLKEVIDAVGEHAELAWSLSGAHFNGDVTSVWSDGPLAVEHRSNESGGVEMSWMSMRQLALGCRQIIDGTFVGRTAEGLPQLLLGVFDSSYWVVWAAEDSITERVREQFSNVEDIEISPPSARS